MRNENHLNAEISRKMRAMHGRDKLFHTKISDRFSAGVADFLVWGLGRGAAMEVKFVKKWPSDNALLLVHPFTGAQLTFLESISLSDNPAYGLVAVEEQQCFYVVPYKALPSSGNWTTRVFRAGNWMKVGWLDVAAMVKLILEDV